MTAELDISLRKRSQSVRTMLSCYLMIQTTVTQSFSTARVKLVTDRLKAAGCQALGAKHGPHAILLVLTEGTVAAIGIISTDTARTKCVTYI